MGQPWWGAAGATRRGEPGRRRRLGRPLRGEPGRRWQLDKASPAVGGARPHHGDASSDAQGPVATWREDPASGGTEVPRTCTGGGGMRTTTVRGEDRWKSRRRRAGGRSAAGSGEGAAALSSNGGREEDQRSRDQSGDSLASIATRDAPNPPVDTSIRRDWILSFLHRVETGSNQKCFAMSRSSCWRTSRSSSPCFTCCLILTSMRSCRRFIY
ncbi:unnamed protein product [Urochloa humidicola]